MNLSPEFIEKQRTALLEEKERLEAELKKLKVYPDFGFGEDDNTQEVVVFENNMPLEQEFTYLYKKVNKALKAIENGTYGQCEKCKKALGDERLKIMPYADICVECSKNKKTK